MRTARWLVLILLIGAISVLNASSTSSSLTSTASAAGSISGRITATVGGAGLANAGVRAFDLNNEFFAGNATTDGAGNYVMNLPAGDYAVITSNTGGFINEIWNNVQCSAVCDVNGITPIEVTTNPITGIDFALDAGGRVSGTVTSSSTGLPIAGVTVNLIDPGANVQFTKGVTDVNGVFITEGGTVAGNVYAATVNQVGFQNELYNNIKCEDCDPVTSGATLIAVAGSGTTAGLNFALDPGGTVSGTVTDGNGAPLAHVFVEAVNANFSLVFGSETDASGNFTTGGMPAGTYWVHTYNGLGYVDETYNNVVCPPGFCNPSQVGTPVSVVVGAVSSNIDFSLSPGGSITGAVTNSVGGAPVPLNTGNGGISIFNSLGVLVLQLGTDGAGLYDTPTLPPGTYYAETVNVPGFGNNLYNGIGCSGCNVLTGTPIPITAGSVTPNINFSLTATGSISGTVTNAAGGAALANIQVQAFSSNGNSLPAVSTNASGVYTLTGLAAGSYYVRTNGGGTFINEIYNDIPCQNCAVTTVGATLIPVTAGNTTNSINFALATGGRISGTVTNVSGGAAIQGVAVQVFNAQSVGMGQFTTNASGVYTTPGLPDGTYYVRTNNTLGFINESYNDIQCPITVCVASDGTPISVTSPTTTGGINFALNAGARISGTVTTEGGGPLQNVNVQVHSQFGKNMGFATTDASGNYTTQALPDGTYYLRTTNSLGLIDEVWNNQQCLSFCQPTSGNAVDIAGGVNSTGKNFALSPGGTISGEIRNTGTLLPLSGIQVSVFTETGLFARAAATISNGTYLVAGLAPGTYYMRTVNTQGYYDLIWDATTFCDATCLPTDGNEIVVSAGQVTTGIDFDLSQGVETIQNGSFSAYAGNNPATPTNWSTFGFPSQSDFVGKGVAGTFEYYKTTTPGAAAAILQNTGADFSSGQGILAQFSLANTNNDRKRISVLVHENDFSDIAVCTFWIPPNQGVRRYGILTHTTKAWTNASISFYAASAGTNGGAFRLDDVTMQAAPGPVEDTLCVDPFKPAITSGVNGPEMLTNGDFSTGSVAPWSTPFDISFQVSSGVFEFIRPTGGIGIAGVLQQNTGVPVAAGEIVTATFQLGNSSDVTKRVTVLLLDPNFTDLSACTFWLPPGQPLSPYTMRSYATQAWSQAAIAFFPATVGNQTWIRLDNVSLKKTPNASAELTGTECDEPTIGPEPPPPGSAGFAAGSSGSSGSASDAGSSGAAGSGGIELSADGSAPSVAALRAIDLRQSDGSSLRFQSKRDSDVPRAEVQISLDGHSWQSLVDVPASDDWLSVDVDLSQYSGHLVYIRFVLDGEISRTRPAFGRWLIRKFDIF